MRQVFDPFFTRKSTGTGIGLSICRRFVEAAGGAVSLENREGGGIAATVILPRDNE
jgi:two-component system sensor histidine kinase HydH